MRKTQLVFGAVVLLTGLTVSPLCAQQKGTSSARYVEELTESLSRQVRAAQDENAELSRQVSDYSRKIRTLEEENKELKESVQQLKRQASAETAARDEQIKTLSNQIKKLSDQVVKLANMPVVVPAAVSSGSSGKDKDPDPDGKYEIYEVQQGATLSAIAAAYNVSVADIRKANNMKSDRLKIGQKLKIPVK